MEKQCLTDIPSRKYCIDGNISIRQATDMFNARLAAGQHPVGSNILLFPCFQHNATLSYSLATTCQAYTPRPSPTQSSAE